MSVRKPVGAFSGLGVVILLCALVLTAENSGENAIPDSYAHLKQPALKVEYVKPNSHGLEVRIRLINPSDNALTFTGYSLTSPLYMIQEEVDGEWVNRPIGWCGTGLSSPRLPSGATTVFSIFLHETKPTFRIGINSYTRRRPKPGHEKPLWTDPIRVPGPEAPVPAPL